MKINKLSTATNGERQNTQHTHEMFYKVGSDIVPEMIRLLAGGTET